MLNGVQLDGTPELVVPVRSPIKLATGPQIVVAIPCGDKREMGYFTCDPKQGGCGESWGGPMQKHHNVVPIQFAMAFANMMQPLNTGFVTVVEGGRLSGEARQIMTKEALRLGAKYILYWDDDVIPPPTALYVLHNWMERNPKAGAVSGVYVTRKDPVEPVVYKAHGQGAYWGLPMGPEAEPEEVMGFGAGFVLARLEAIQDVINKMTTEAGHEVPIWADERYIRGLTEAGHTPGAHRSIMWGHDLRFCKNLTEWGWPVYAHGGVLCGHYDIATNRTFVMPPDAPGFKVNINTAKYWDQVYGHEGANTWRKYPEMFGKVLAAVSPECISAVELGCGVGVLGSMLTAKGKVRAYKGYDISPAAIDICKARFLDAEVLDVRNLQTSHLGGLLDTAVIATELMEHLNEDVFYSVLDTVSEARFVRQFIFTVPDNCMGPDTVREHTALFNEDLVRERLFRYTTQWSSLTIEKAGDNAHLVCVLTR